MHLEKKETWKLSKYTTRDTDRVISRDAINILARIGAVGLCGKQNAYK